MTLATLMLMSTSLANTPSVNPPKTLSEIIANAEYAGEYEVGEIEHIELYDGYVVREVVFHPVDTREREFDPITVRLPGGTVGDLQWSDKPRLSTGDQVFALLQLPQKPDLRERGVRLLAGPNQYSIWYPVEVDGVEGLRTGDGWGVTDISCDARPTVRRPHDSSTVQMPSIMEADTESERAEAEEAVAETAALSEPLMSRHDALDAFKACMGGAE